MAFEINNTDSAPNAEMEYYSYEDVKETAPEYGKVVLLDGSMVDACMIRSEGAQALAST